MNLDKITTLISIIAAVFAAFLYLQAAHFGAEEGAALEIDVQRQITELDVDRNSKIRVYYERKLDAGEVLSTADQRRYEQIRRDLERGQDKLDLLQ